MNHDCNYIMSQVPTLSNEQVWAAVRHSQNTLIDIHVSFLN